jgi:hypothetical protein
MSKDPFAAFNLPPQPRTFSDAPAHRLARKTDPSTSKEAAKKVRTSKNEKAVYEFILACGAKGCISEQVVDALVRDSDKKIPYSSISGRFRTLMDKKFIFDSGERRIASTGNKQRVMVAYKYYDDVEHIPIVTKQKRCPHCGGGL